MKLTAKIAVYVAIVIVIIAVGLGLISSYFSRDALIEKVETNLLQVGNEDSKNVDLTISSRIQILQEVANRQQVRNMDYFIQRNSIKGDIERLGYLDMAVVLPSGEATYITTGEKANLGDRDYIKKALSGVGNVSDVLISKVTGEAVIMYAVPIYNDQNVVGALIGRTDGNSLSDITNNIKFGNKDYAFIIGKDATFYAYPDKEYVMKQINIVKEAEKDKNFADFAKHIKAVDLAKQSVIEYNFNGVKQITALTPITGTGWILCTSIEKNEATGSVNKLTLYIILISLFFVIIGIASSIALSFSISRPIVAVSKKLNDLAKYDFTSNNHTIDKFTARKDELGIISHSLKTMQEHLIDLIKNISLISNKVADSSHGVNEATQQIVSMADQTSASVDEIAKGAFEQARDTEKGSSYMNSLSEIIIRDGENRELLNTAADYADKLKSEGAEIVGELLETNKVTISATNEIHRVISETQESSQKIQIASQMIEKITQQTNLLALNASIEAARAGESGRGFAVVAEEIGKLAEQSGSFTRQINSVIKELAQKIDFAVNTIQEVDQIISGQTDIVGQTKEKFDGIAESLTKIKSGIVSLNLSGNEIEDKKNEMINILGNLSAISQENAAATEETLATVESQTTGISHIADASKELAVLAKDMEKNINKFKF